VIVLVLLLLAFAAYSVAWPQAPIQTTDSPSYVQLARDIRNLHLRELSLRTPGLPLLLILTRSSERISRSFFYATLVLHFAAVGLLAYLLYALRTGRKLILLVILVGLLPPYVEPSAYLMPETPSQFTVVLTFVSLILWVLKPNPFLLVTFGIALLLAAIVRPTYELLVVVMLGCLVAGYAFRLFPHVSSGRLMLIMGFAGILSFGTEAAWSALNYFQFGYFGTTRMLPIQLSTKTMDSLEFLPPEYADLRRILIPYRDQNLTEAFLDHTGKDYIYRAMPAVTKHYGGDMTAVTTHLTAALSYLIRHKPMSYLINCLRSFGLFWMPNDCELCGRSVVARGLTAIIEIAVEIVFLVQALALAGIGLVYFSARLTGRLPEQLFRDGTHRMLAFAYASGLAIVIYTALLSCCFGTGIPRYRQTVDLLILCACALGHALWRSILAKIPPSVRLA
jgi:hypothetical protein